MEKQLTSLLLGIKVFFSDADGVFFDGDETRMVTATGEVLLSKRRSYLDGQGLSFIRGMGVRVVFVSGEGEPLESIVQKLNTLPSVKDGSWPPVELFTKKNSKGAKLETIQQWLKDNNFSPSQCAYMGDDINDFEPMTFLKQNGALIVAPQNATRKIRPLAHIITRAHGGRGAIREFAEMVLDARGVNETTLPPS